MWVDEETYNGMMLGTLAGTIIGLMFAAVIWIFRLAFGANRWFYNFLKDKGLKGWQSFLICTGTTACAFVFFCSPFILSGVKTLAQNSSQVRREFDRQSEKRTQETTIKKIYKQKTRDAN